LIGRHLESAMTCTGIRIGQLLIVGVVIGPVIAGLAPLTARADSPQVENEDSRFTFHRTDDGYLRLDGRTGQVSLCSRRPAGWTCQLIPDERNVLETEIARLQADNALLKRELLTHNLALPGSIKPDPPGTKVDEPRVSLPSDAELNRMMAFIEKVWKRMMEMIVATQRDMKKS
jgi:hypothetical protein